MLTERQKEILQLIIRGYGREAQAVSSENIAEVLGVSSATIRNDMAAMTEAGYLAQPHTSAGRIPSEKGWRYYIDAFLDTEKALSKKEHSALVDIIEQAVDRREQSKMLAKSISEFAGNAVMVAFGPRDIYYTGLTNLFSQPEFQQMQSVVHISRVIDHLDDVMLSIYDSIDGMTVAVGRQNPFSAECGVVMTDLAIDNERWIMSILGPIRMAYDHNYALLKTIKSLV